MNGISRESPLKELRFDFIMNSAPDLMHIEAEGLLQLHFRLLHDNFLYPKGLMQDFDAMSRKLQHSFRMDKFHAKDLNHWIGKLNAHQKLCSALLSPVFLSKHQGNEHVDLWLLHVEYLSILLSFQIDDVDLGRCRFLIGKVYHNLKNLYQGALDGNTNVHLLTHIPDLIQRLGIPRGFWTFTGESIIGAFRRVKI